MYDRSELLTEQRLPESTNLDVMSVEEAVALMNAQDSVAVAAVAAERANVARAVELVAGRLARGGRLIYVGAGTSGRLGVLDAAECPPTFRTSPEQVQGIIAGGEASMFRAAEGAEDRAEDGAAAVDARQAGANDVVMGIAAGGTTPFVHAALRRARERGASTIFLSCVQPVAGEPTVDVVIRPLTGPEVLTGSTRLKAGTATKLVLNTITTLAMVRLGKVHQNLMVDLRASNAKLWDRGTRIISAITGLGREPAMELLRLADGRVKRAIVMHARCVGAQDAVNMLSEAGGRLRDAIDGEMMPAPRDPQPVNPATSPTLEDAIALAVEAHRGQKEKAGQPYVLHVLRVMFRCEADLERIVAVLHDVVEDTGRGFEDLRKLGYSEEVLAALDCVTKREGENYEQFVARAASNPVARRVKLADLEDNMDLRRLVTVEPKDAERMAKYVKAWRMLKGL